MTDGLALTDQTLETTLVIDSATDACSVALFRGAKFQGAELIAGEYRLLGRGHAEALVPMIAALPDHGKSSRIAVSMGPGSFTGVRVGLAAARALGLAWGAPVIGYSTLSLIAAMARSAHGSPVAVGAAMTGGHGEWFVEGFGTDGATTRPLASLRADDAAAASTEDVIAGNQAEALVALRGHGSALPLLPDARAFALLPQSGLLADLHPIYGRPPDAKPSAQGFLQGSTQAAKGPA